MYKRNFFLVSALLILAAMVLTACGPKAVSFDVEMKDFAFEPNTWEVPAGAKVTLNLTNTGTQEHEYVIMVLGKSATTPFDDDDEPNGYPKPGVGLLLGRRGCRSRHRSSRWGCCRRWRRCGRVGPVCRGCPALFVNHGLLPSDLVWRSGVKCILV